MTTNNCWIRLVLLAVAAAATVSGCAQNPLTQEGPKFDLVTPAERHPILVTTEPRTLAVSTRAGSFGLSPKARADILTFVRRHTAEAGGGKLVLSAPGGARNEAAVVDTVTEIRDLLIEAGYDRSRVDVEVYRAPNAAHPPVRLSYVRHLADAPRCGQWPRNLAYEPNNSSMDNLGCATQANFAAMVAEPADLLRPRATTPRSGERRGAVWEKYQKGEDTASSKSEDGRVSTKGNN
jgi:pilus assembly protein CpaD